MVRRYPRDLDVQLLVAESRLVDLKDPAAALEVGGRITVAKEERRLRLRHGLLLVDALWQLPGARAYRLVAPEGMARRGLSVTMTPG